MRPRCLADVRAWRDNAFRDATRRLSFFNARRTALERRGEARLPARRRADCALRLVAAFALRGVPSLTPERRAFDSPIAIACFVDRAPCLPSRMWWISSRTNSPACVEGDLPCRLSLRARLMVSFSGIVRPPSRNTCNAGAINASAKATARQADN